MVAAWLFVLLAALMAVAVGAVAWRLARLPRGGRR
jgi:hypothetical protein